MTLGSSSAYAQYAVPRLAMQKVINTAGLGGPVDPLINVFGAHSVEPAPMGIADYGIGPNGPYQYSTNSSLGLAGIASLSTRNSSGDPWMSIQLNVNLQFSDGNKPYVYWVQDVAQINTLTNRIYLLDNVWNSSANAAAMNSAGIAGNGQVAKSGSYYYYYDVASSFLPGNGVLLVYPAVVEFRVNSSVDATRHPMVTFEYNDGQGWQKYDAVVFKSANHLTALNGFVVNGFNYNPNGFYDSELIIGGVAGGIQTSDVQSDLRLQLEYWNGHNYQLVTNAYNFGSDTAEGISNVLSQWFYFPSNGGVIAEVQSGAGTLGKLWDQSGVSIVDLKTSLVSGRLDVRNSSNLAGTAGQYAFTNGEVTVILQPGSYQLQVYSGASLTTAGKYTLTAGQLLQLRTPLGIIPLTLSYSVAGGGSGFSPPSLTYSYNGGTLTTPLGTTPTAYDMDSGTTWTVTSLLPGSSGIERWQTTQPTTGSASSAGSVSITYYHQYLVPTSYSVAGGGSGYLAPSLSGAQFGSAAVLPLGTSPASYWLDSGTAYSATNPLGGSTATERWFASSAQGSVAGTNSIIIPFAHQFYLTVTGGGAPSQWYDSGTQGTYSTPGVTARQSGTGTRLTSYSLDGGTPVAIQLTTGNFVVSVLMNAPHALVFAGVTQFQLSFSPGGQNAAASVTAPTIGGDTSWYDTGTNVGVVLNGVYGRTAGSGNRVASYSWDGGPIVGETTGGAVRANITMNSPHMLSVNAVVQFQVSLNPGITSSLASITSPTVAGDNYWYDSGTAINVGLNGIWGRAGGQGFRLTSYSLNGVQTQVASATVVMISIASLSSPTTLDGSTARQYLLTTSSGSVASESPSAIAGDSGWYDSGSAVTVTYNFIWNATANVSRLSALSYAVDNAAATLLTRSDTGTFQLMQTMAGPHTVTVAFVKQYSLAVSGGSGVRTSSQSPTDDGFYDQGSNSTVSSNYTWNVVDGNTRQNLFTYSLDGKNYTVPRADSGDFTTPTVTFNAAHQVSFNPVTQYLQLFKFVDGSGKNPIVPESFAISLNGTSQKVAQSIWLDSKASFTISSLLWENSDVKPLNSIVYQVNSPASIPIDSRVYRASVRVTDAFGLYVSGAQVVIKLVNGSAVTRITNSSGVAGFGLIPIGTYSGSITNLGLPIPTSISADASSQSEASATISTSAPVLGAVLAVAALIVGALLLRRRGRSKTAAPKS